MQGVYTHAGLLGEAGQGPLADVVREIERGHVCVLDERLADDVDGEVLGRLDVLRGVFLTSGRGDRDRDRDDGRKVCDLTLHGT